MVKNVKLWLLFFKFHESQQRQHGVYKLRHFYKMHAFWSIKQPCHWDQKSKGCGCKAKVGKKV